MSQQLDQIMATLGQQMKELNALPEDDPAKIHLERVSKLSTSLTHFPDHHPAREVIQETIILFIFAPPPKNLSPEYAQHEAMVLTAYAVRNSDIVETVLHSGSGQILTDELMPQFTGEISRRLFGILALKEHLFKIDRQDIWKIFITLYHARFYQDWRFQ